MPTERAKREAELLLVGLPAFLWSQNHRLIDTEIRIIWRHPVSSFQRWIN